MPVYTIGRPETSEHAPYYGKYIQLVPETDIVEAMTLQIEQTLGYLRGLSDGHKRYAPGKWSVNEVIGHMSDAERLFAARALHFARNTPGQLPSMDQEVWMKAATFDSQPLKNLISEFELIRRSNICLFQQLNEEAWNRRGIASEFEFTVRSLAYIIVGHERHHLDILKTRYR